MSRWIRLDTTWSSSAWIADLPPEARLVWVELLCYAKAHGIGGVVRALPTAVAARTWGVTRDACDAALRAAEMHGALTITDGSWVLTAWKKYQGDETSSDRSKRYRKSKSQLSPSRPSRVTEGASRSVTPTVTETKTNTETILASHNAHAGASWTSASWNDLPGEERLRRWLGPELAGVVDRLPIMAAKGIGGAYCTPLGTAEYVWGHLPDDQRPTVLADACERWLSEDHPGFHAKFFRRMLQDCIQERVTPTTATRHKDTPDGPRHLGRPAPAPARPPGMYTGSAHRLGVV